MKEGQNQKRTIGYDDIKAGGGTSQDIPPGRYEAIIGGATLQEPTEKGQSLRLNMELCSDEFINNSLPAWFKFYQADGSVNEFGIKMWKSTLARLGYEDVKESELPELLQQISEDRPGVIVKVSYQKVGENTYQRADIEGTCDNDVVARYKDERNDDIVPF